VPVKKIIHYLTEDLWRIRLRDQPKRKSFWIKTLRVMVLSARGFDEDRCMLRASALTFYSLISIVPILAMIFGIAKGFGFEKILEERVREQFQGQEEVITHALTFSKNLLENTQGGLIASLGIIFLFWAIIKVLGNIERSFNEIWGIKKHRSLVRKFSDYLSFMLICPILFIVASSMTVVVSGQVKGALSSLPYLSFLVGPMQILLRLLPFAILWGLFTFMYLFLPNGKVNLRSALIGGIMAGTIYQVAQWGYITFQIGIASYNAIYGSFAALPLFLVWLQLSWLILLYGAEVSFAHQNAETYEYEQDCLRIRLAFKRLITLAVVKECIERFCQKKSPPTAVEISHALGSPIRLVNDILYDLVAAGILSELAGDQEKAPAYQPAIDIGDLTIRDVLDRLDDQGIESIPLAKSEAVEKLTSSLDRFKQILAGSPENVILKDL